MTAERLLIFRWRDRCSHPSLGPSVNQRLLAHSAAVTTEPSGKCLGYDQLRLSILLGFTTTIKDKLFWNWFGCCFNASGEAELMER